jgi:hypothetical protein
VVTRDWSGDTPPPQGVGLWLTADDDTWPLALRRARGERRRRSSSCRMDAGSSPSTAQTDTKEKSPWASSRKIHASASHASR